MPTAQRLYKTLDSTNYPETWDNILFHVVNAWLYHWTYDNTARPMFAWYWNYKQNDGTKKSNSTVALAKKSGSTIYYILKGYANDYQQKTDIIMILQGRDTGWNDTVYQRFKQVGLFAYNDTWKTYYGTYGSGGYAGQKKDKTYMGFNVYAPNDAIEYNLNTNFWETDGASDTKLISSEVSYTLQNDKLFMVSGNYAPYYPVQLENVRNDTIGNKYDMEYVTFGSRGQTLTGWGSQGKSQSNTSNIQYSGMTSMEDLATSWPWIYHKTAPVTTDLVSTSGGNYLTDAHAYYTSSEDYTVYDAYALTNEYANSGLISKIKANYPSYIVTINGTDYYKYSGGLILCEIPKKGKLTFKVTAKTDNVYLYLYDKPSGAGITGINVPGLSNSSRGNGIPLTKNTEKTITIDVEAKIYYFRFGTYGSNWQQLGGGAQIQFANEFELEFEN